MIDFLPIHLYTPLFYHILLVVVLITFIHTQTSHFDSNKNISFMRYSGYVLLIFVLFYMGLRPSHWVFVDMNTYSNMFTRFQQGHIYTKIKDPVFNNYLMYSSKIMSVQTFFFVCAMLYVVPLYVASKKWFKKYWFYAFLFLVASFSFWAYGVNGIRSGIASSLFILGISRDKRLFQILWLLLAIGFHKSMLLPTLGFILASVYNKPKIFMIFWILAIPFSILFRGYWEHLFASFGFDERLNQLTQNPKIQSFNRIGFRWDFLLYSAIAVFAGWYYIFKLKFKDNFYFILFNIYLFANAFWILVIRSNFSNRFAYLSWFLMALVIIYPLLKQKTLPRRHNKIGYILISYYAFTYIMAIIFK